MVLKSRAGTENGGDGYDLTTLPLGTLKTQLKVCLLHERYFKFHAYVHR